MHLLSLISFPLGYCRVSQRFVFDLSDFLLVEILLCVLLIILVKGIFELKLSKLGFAMAKTTEATNYLEELVNLEALQKKECKYFNKMLKSPPKCPTKIPSVTATSKADLVNSELSKHSISNGSKVYSAKSEISKESTSKTNVKIDEPDEKASEITTKVSGCLIQEVPANEQVESNTSLVKSQSGGKRVERRSRLPVPPKPKTPVDPPEAGDSTKMNITHSAPTESVKETSKVNPIPTDLSATCFVNSELNPSGPTDSLKFNSSKMSSSNQQILLSSCNSNPIGNTGNRCGERAAHKTSSSSSKISKAPLQGLTAPNTGREKCPSKALRNTSKHPVQEISSRTSTSRGSSRGSSS